MDYSIAMTAQTHQARAIQDGLYTLSTTRFGFYNLRKALADQTNSEANHTQDRLTEVNESSAIYMPIWNL
jgi:hypothetical protein